MSKANIRVPIIKRYPCASGSFRYKTLSVQKGIKALFCCHRNQFRRGRCQNGMKIVTVLYSTSRWTPARAKAHAKKRFMRRSRR